MNTLILARHAHSASNVADTVNGIPPGLGLSAIGSEQARTLGRELASEAIDVGISSRLERTRQTLTLALDGRGIPLLVEPLLDEVGFGSFEGCPLVDYRAWAWNSGPTAACPGGGETRAAIAARLASGLDALMHRPETTVAAVSHGLPVRYVLDAAEGRIPSARPEHVPHATAYRLERRSIALAAETLREWAAAPHFAETPADTPIGG